MMFLTPELILTRYSTTSAAIRIAAIIPDETTGEGMKNKTAHKTAQLTIVIPIQKTVL